MSYDSMLFEDGGRQAKGATYENKTVGLNGDTETLIITSADTAFNTDIIGGGTAYVMGGTATQTLVDADDARLFVWGIDGNVGSAVGVSATNAGSVYVQSGAVINNAVITNRARLMIENSIGTNITCATGAQLHISSGAVVTGTEIMSGGSQIVSAGGTSKDLTVDKGGIVIFKGGEGKLGGKVNIYGSVKFLSNCTANLNGSTVTFHLEGRTASDTVFVDTPMENFTNGSFAITVSNSQADGVYLLAKTTTAMPSFSSSISIVNMAGATIGTLKIDQTFTVASGTYSLAVKSVALDPRYPTKLSNVLCLTVTTTPGNVNWPSDWPNAPTTVKTAAAATSVILDSTYNTANGVAAVTASGTYGTITTNTASDFFVNIVAGSKIDKVIGYTQSNYLYLNGGNVRYLYGSYKNNNTGVNITVASGIVRFLVAAGQDLTVAGNVNITFTANADVTHTANIFGGAIAIDKSSEVTGQITLSLTDANFNGLIFGGGRALNTGITASANDIVINATGITQTQNHKGITSGTTNWIVGGGQALNGATVTAANVTINAVDSKLGQIVGGAEAKGNGAIGSVDNPAITSPGAIGKVVPGYVAQVVDEFMQPVPNGTPGRLAVKGPTGCRYLADARQERFVQQGWNLPGDTFVQDDDGYLYYQARNDDMIISAGYNIAGPEVEDALLRHEAVAECGVVGKDDDERGQVVAAFVVLKPGYDETPEMAAALQNYVKATIAPYKYPRVLEFVEALPRTETGKLQRFVLRRLAGGAG